jgi:hypothetical protein
VCVCFSWCVCLTLLLSLGWLIFLCVCVRFFIFPTLLLSPCLTSYICVCSPTLCFLLTHLLPEYVPWLCCLFADFLPACVRVCSPTRLLRFRWVTSRVCARALASTLLFRLNVADFLLVCVCVCGRPPVRRACSVCSRPCCYSLADLLPAWVLAYAPKQFSLSGWLTASLSTFLWTYESAPFLAVPPCILSFSSSCLWFWLDLAGWLTPCVFLWLGCFPIARWLTACVCVCLCPGRFTLLMNSLASPLHQ